MSETKQYQPTELEKALKAWVQEALNQSSIDDVVVLYNYQGYGRRKRPFITIQILTDVQLQDAFEQLDTDTPNADGSFPVDIYELHGGTVRIQCYGSLSWVNAKAVARSLRVDAITRLNKSNNLAITQGITPIMDIPEQMATHVEPRRFQDFSFNYCEVTRLRGGDGVIEKVIASGTIDGVDTSCEVPWPSP